MPSKDHTSLCPGYSQPASPLPAASNAVTTQVPKVSQLYLLWLLSIQYSRMTLTAGLHYWNSHLPSKTSWKDSWCSYPFWRRLPTFFRYRRPGQTVALDTWERRDHLPVGLWWYIVICETNKGIHHHPPDWWWSAHSYWSNHCLNDRSTHSESNGQWLNTLIVTETGSLNHRWGSLYDWFADRCRPLLDYCRRSNR